MESLYLGTDGFTVKLLLENLYKTDNYKADSRKTNTFFVPQMNFLPKIFSIKRTQVKKQFSRKKTYIFFEESHKMLSTVTKKLGNLQLQNKKQKSI